jgi:hypothetical protein
MSRSAVVLAVFRWFLAVRAASGRAEMMPNRNGQQVAIFLKTV